PWWGRGTRSVPLNRAARKREPVRDTGRLPRKTSERAGAPPGAEPAHGKRATGQPARILRHAGRGGRRWCGRRSCGGSQVSPETISRRRYNPATRPQETPRMKLGTLKEGGRDGTLVVVSRDLTRAVRATGIAATLQQALDDWQATAPRLNALAAALEEGRAEGVFELDHAALAAPLPRAYEFVDGSAYLPHVERVRRARGAEVPESFYTDPLMYQATSAGFLGPRDPVRVVSEDYGIDLEAEIVVVT